MVPRWRRVCDSNQTKQRQTGNITSSMRPKTDAGSLEPESTAQLKKDAEYPKPTIQPPDGTHTHTAIILHGRGDTGPNFGLLFLASTTSDGLSLAEALPGFRFVFPTAKKRRIASLNRTMTSQWFDIRSLRDPSVRQEDQCNGIHESSVFLHELIKEEAALVGLDRVFIGGLSQGMAIGLHVMLNYMAKPLDGQAEPSARLAGFFGMSGWLPFAGTMLQTCFEEKGHEPPDSRSSGKNKRNEQSNRMGAKAASGEAYDSDASANSSDTGNNDKATGAAASSGDAAGLIIRFGDEEKPVAATPAHAAFALARDIASLPPLSLAQSQAPFVPTPVFLGHGTADEKVAYRLGEEARDLLTALGCNVQWRGYKGLGHWYQVPEEIDDIVRFIRRVTAVEKPLSTINHSIL